MWALRGSSDVRCGDDDLCVYKVLVELGVLALLVGGGDELVALLLDPFPDTELVLSGSEKLGLLLGVDATLGATVRGIQPRRIPMANLHRRGQEVLFPVVKPSRSAF